MVVLDTFGEALSLLRRHPALLAYLVVFGFVGNVFNVGEYLALPDAWLLLLAAAALVLGPAIAVGTIGLVDRAVVDGRVSAGAFASSAIENYLPLVAIALIFVVAAFVAAFALFVAFQIPVVNLLAALAAFALGLWVALTLQFVDLALVVDDEGPVEAISRSYAVATANLGDVVGYTLLEAVIAIGFVLPLLVVLLGTEWPETSPTLGLSPEVVAALAVAGVGSAVLQTWRVTFYRTVSDRTGGPGGTATGVTAHRSDYPNDQ